VCAREVGESGTPHLQGRVTFKRAYRFAALKKLAAHFHWEATKAAQDTNYLRKVGNTFVRDDPVRKSQGTRNDLVGGLALLQNGMSIMEFRMAEPLLAAKYGSYFSIMAMQLARPTCPDIELYDWQEYLVYDVLGYPPDSRAVYVVVDPQGNGGKSTFAKWLLCKFPGTELFGNGKSHDLAYAVQNPKLAIFDFVRSQDAFRPWSTVEAVKNGCVFNSKYESGAKYFPTPHVFVFTNAEVPFGVLSADRLCVLRISEPLVDPSVEGGFSSSSSSFIAPWQPWDGDLGVCDRE
jgi:hypothetical protein